MTSQQQPATYTVLTRSQLDTIKARVANTDSDWFKQEEQRRLKQLSDDRSAKWPNTLQAQRARKERARVERMAAEEAERIEADRAEAEYRSEQRRVQIERANKILFDETDKVKALHGKMLQSDAIKENAALVDFKKQIDVLYKAQEAAFVEQQRQALEAAEVAELAKWEATRQRALEQKTIQQQQLEEMKTRILAERAEDKREGELVKIRARQEAEELKIKEAARLARAKQLNADTKEANRTLQAFKLKEKELIQQQDLAIEAYSLKKSEMQAERERREAERRARKDADRKAITDMMEKNYTDFHHKEETRLARDVAHAEARATADEISRRQRIKDSIAAIDRSNKLQLSQKAEAKARIRAEDEAYLRTWEVRVRELKEEEAAEIAARLADAKKLQSLQQPSSVSKACMDGARGTKAGARPTSFATKPKLPISPQPSLWPRGPEPNSRRRAADMSAISAGPIPGFQKHQAGMKSRRKADKHLEDQQDAAQIQMALQEQDEMFNAYAHECLTEYASQGKTTVPMQILLNKRPTLDLLL